MALFVRFQFSILLEVFMSRYFLIFVSFCVLFQAVDAAEPIAIYDATKTPVEKVLVQDVHITSQQRGLQVITGTANQWPGIQLNGPWALKDYGSLVVELENIADSPLTIFCRIDMPGGDGSTGKGTITESVTITPKSMKTWTMKIPAPVSKELGEKFFAMRGDPFRMNSGDKSGFDRSTVTELRLFVGDPKRVHKFVLSGIKAMPDTQIIEFAKYDLKEFFPMIDEFGQFIHRDWPGKVKDLADLQSRIEEEAADIEKYPSPENRNKYGGWTTGPKLDATGHFYPAKVDGKWWLVDPEGCLFWSHGTDCVTTGNGVTPITDREFYFTSLPENGSPFARFYGTGNWAPHNYYEGKGEYKTYNFTTSNLFKKYGPDWNTKHAQFAHKRLKSWGMNTIANWSDAGIYGMRQTPYTATVGATCPPIRGSEGYWGKFSDPFHEDFRNNYRRAFERQKTITADDPWCIGYFVDNEISWGDEGSLALAALSSPADQPVKIVMVDWLKKKYDNSIEELNTTWGTDYADWNAVLESTRKPNAEKSNADLRAFYSVIADQYFKVLSEELKRTAPNKMYLGCRFAWGNDLATREAAKYCDVISFNQYVYELDSFKLPPGIDKPCIIGEFHFGALDRGMFHTGLCPTKSQAERATAYEKYVLSALKNPLFVGTHWFQYADQATTGRGDGENYQIGLIDICDSPYPETIDAVRKIGYQLYELRR